MVKICHPDHGLSDSQNTDRVTMLISSASTAHPTKAKIASPLIQKSYALEIKACSQAILSISKLLLSISILWSLTRSFVQSLRVVWFHGFGSCFGPVVLSLWSLSFHCVQSTHSRTTGDREGIMPSPSLAPAPCLQYHWEPVQ